MWDGHGRKKDNRNRVRRLGPSSSEARELPRDVRTLLLVLGPATEVGPPDLTVGRWLALHEENPQEAGAVLLAAIRVASRRKRAQSADRDDLTSETAARILNGNAVALRRAPPSTPLPAWVHGCVANVWREMCRARHKVQIEEVSSHTPSPYELLAERDETKHERVKVDPMTEMGLTRRRHDVLFLRAAELVRSLYEARDEKTLGRLHHSSNRIPLMIVYELGFVPLDRTGAELLINMLAERQDRRSTILTTTFAFREWVEVSGLIYRMGARSHVLTTRGDSYRIRRRRGKDVPFKE